MRVYFFLIRYIFFQYLLIWFVIRIFHSWKSDPNPMKYTGVLVVINICKKLFFYSLPVVYFSCLFSLQVWVFNRISVYLLCCFFWHFLFPFLASLQTPNPQQSNTFSPHNYIYKGPELLHAKLHFIQCPSGKRGRRKKALASLLEINLKK